MIPQLKQIKNCLLAVRPVCVTPVRVLAEADGLAEPSRPVGDGDDDDVQVTQNAVVTRCPYTGQDMTHPVRNKHCGHNYDRDGIGQYVKCRGKRARFVCLCVRLLSVCCHIVCCLFICCLLSFRLLSVRLLSFCLFICCLLAVRLFSV